MFKEGDTTDNIIIGIIIAFLAGTLVAYINYLISKYTLKKHPEKFATMQMLRQVIQIGFLVGVFLGGLYTPWDPMWLLVGGCLGVTLPMFFFTYRLVKLNDKNNRKEDDE